MTSNCAIGTHRFLVYRGCRLSQGVLLLLTVLGTGMQPYEMVVQPVLVEVTTKKNRIFPRREKLGPLTSHFIGKTSGWESRNQLSTSTSAAHEGIFSHVQLKLG